MTDADINFYFDPLCPFAWMTSTWVRQVAAHRDYAVDWRFISLRMINADVDYDRRFPAGYEAGHGRWCLSQKPGRACPLGLEASRGLEGHVPSRRPTLRSGHQGRPRATVRVASPAITASSPSKSYPHGP